MGTDSSAEGARRQDLRERLGRLRGAEALYREGKRFSRVRIDATEAGEDGVTVRVSLRPARGLCNDLPASWDVRSAWDGFACSEDQLVVAHIGLTMYFEPALIAAVVAWCERLPDAPYSASRSDQIFGCIRAHRASQLAQELSGECQLFWRDRPIGVVSEQLMSGYPEVRATFAPAEVDADLKRALDAYRAWWSNSDEVADGALTEKLSGGWWLQSADGLRIDSLIPIIDFERGTIIMRYRGRTRRGA